MGLYQMAPDHGAGVTNPGQQTQGRPDGGQSHCQLRQDHRPQQAFVLFGVGAGFQTVVLRQPVCRLVRHADDQAKPESPSATAHVTYWSRQDAPLAHYQADAGL